MLEKISHVAEQVATNVSRRGLLGKLGVGALLLGGLLGGWLAFPTEAVAGYKHCCCAPFGTGTVRCKPPLGCPCPSGFKFCRHVVAGADDHTPRLWDTATGRPVTVTGQLCLADAPRPQCRGRPRICRRGCRGCTK